MLEILKETLGRKLYSNVWFDREMGNLYASLSKKDVDGVRSLF
jgi:hypothetical protein